MPPVKFFVRLDLEQIILFLDGLVKGSFYKDKLEKRFMTTPDLSVDIGGITLQNPIMTASGTFGYALEFKSLIDLNRLGGVIVKGLSLRPTKGNPPPRIVETPCGMLNAIGLENIGMESFINRKIPQLSKLNVPIFANIYGETIEAYAELAQRLEDVRAIAGIEVNISCPNVKKGGVAFGTDIQMASQVVETVRRNYGRYLMVKLSPNVTDIVQIARGVEDAGADGISLINTLTGMAIDIHSRKPKIANITGGLSGPAIRPVAVRMVWQVARAVKVPVIGVGGIMRPEDALEFIIAGASAVQVGTANFIDPQTTIKIVSGIQDYLIQYNLPSLKLLIGSMQTF